MIQVFASWSGGKDCCFSVYRAITDGQKVRYLANMVTEDGKRSCSHGLAAWVIQVQAQAIGIPLVQPQTTRDSYETVFKKTLRTFKREGIDGGVFGDIDFIEHRQWIERVCKETDIIPYLPLWERNQNQIMREFIALGFEAVVIAAKADLFNGEILGRKIDLDFLNYLEELSKTKPITPCGEAGEYHTLVIDGPIFQKRVEILETTKVPRDEHWFLEILKADLKTKVQT